MTRRIARAIVGVTAVVLVMLGLPLAIAVERAVESAEIVKLQVASAAAIGEVELPVSAQQLESLDGDADKPPPFAVYSPDGVKVHGEGPAQADDVVRTAMQERRVVTLSANRLIVAAPIFGKDERLEGAVWLSRSRHELNQRTRTVWGVLIAAGLLAIGVSWLLARRVARQLAAPIEALAKRADNLVHGTDHDEMPRTGVQEIDQLGDALHASSVRGAEALARERQFSADVSHQLRTPLSAIRLKLETAHAGRETDALAKNLLADLDRVDATVGRLLALARDATPIVEPIELSPIVEQTLNRWREPLGRAGRTIEGRLGADAVVTASANSVGQVLDVLIDNALRYGAGSVTLTTRVLSSAVAIDVADAGQLSPSMTEAQLFARREGTGQGIGLSIARSLAEADNGRLVLTQSAPTTFTFFLHRSPVVDER